MDNKTPGVDTNNFMPQNLISVQLKDVSGWLEIWIECSKMLCIAKWYLCRYGMSTNIILVLPFRVPALLLCGTVVRVSHFCSAFTFLPKCFTKCWYYFHVFVNKFCLNLINYLHCSVYMFNIFYFQTVR